MVKSQVAAPHRFPAQTQPLAETLNRLQQLRRHHASSLPAAARPILRAVTTLIDQLPDLTTAVTPTGVKSAFHNSGIFFENKLLSISRKEALQTDLKKQLLTLAARLNSMVSEPTSSTPPANSRLLTDAITPTRDRIGTLLSETTTADSASPATPKNPTLPPAAPSPPPFPVLAREEKLQKTRTIAKILNEHSKIQPLIQMSPSGKEASTPPTPLPLPQEATSATPTPVAGHIIGAIRSSHDALTSLVRQLFFRETVRPDSQPKTRGSRAPSTPVNLFLAEVATQIDHALARIRGAQLTSLSQDSDNPLSWVFELPLKHNDRVHTVHIQMDQETSHSDNRTGDTMWRIILSFNFDTTGPLQARITLRGKRVNMVFLSEQPATVARLNREFDRLATRLNTAGLKIDHLSARHQTVVTRQFSLQSTRIVDTHV